MLEHYGYRPLPQHMGPSLYKEQLGWLEIAVKEYDKRIKRDYTPRHTLSFEQKIEGKVYAYLKAHGDFIAYRELGDLMKISRKSAANAVHRLRGLGYTFKELKKGQVVYVKVD